MLLFPMIAMLTAKPTPPPEPMREFRAAWVATVDNIDWPSKRNLPVSDQKEELVRILERAANLHLNAILFQVRPMADALYESKLEPWSEFLTGTQGKAPDPKWDPLSFAVTEAHKRGLELHAWINPFRAWHPAAKSAPAKNGVRLTHPSWVKTYGSFRWLDPGEPAAQAHTLEVIKDLLQRYDIDGLHIDDYFYPYPVEGQDFPDDDSFHAYKQGGGRLDRADWRRQNVDHFVQAMYEWVKARKPWVKVGISPFGIYRPGIPEGIQSKVDQYDGLYADPKKWLEKGWCDYMTPQLYWKISQTHQAYPALLSWWEAQNGMKRHLWPGNYASQLFTVGWPPSEILNQIRTTRSTSGADGNVFFSMRAFMQDSSAINEKLIDGPYKDSALVPASPWLGGRAPLTPKVAVKKSDGDWTAKVELKEGWQLLVRARYGDRWVTFNMGVGEITLPQSDAGVPISEVEIAGVDRYGVLGENWRWLETDK